jgi:hypothetical protein
MGSGSLARETLMTLETFRCHGKSAMEARKSVGFGRLYCYKDENEVTVRL